ncbi:MAG: efflux RND transporter periplasmic adaptor subunit [Nitrospirota bacterium]|jgi:HlyD family secretion protein
MRRPALRVVLLVLFVSAVAGGVWLWQSKHEKESRHELVLFGNVDIRQVNLAFNITERIETVLAQEGDRVREGQLLATLDDRRLKHEVDRSEALVAAQREVVARLEAGTRPEEIGKARADVEAAKAELHLAELTYRRVRNLAGEDVLSEQRKDDARAALETAQARLKALQKALDLAIAGPRREDIAAARATLKAYEAQLDVARRELSYASLYAPSDGVVQVRLLEPGDMASAQKAVLIIALDDPLWVRAYVPETELGKIWTGMSAVVSTDTYPGKRYKAWIGFISPTAQFTPKSVETKEVRTSLVYQVRVYVCNPQHELRMGMPATVTVPLNQAPAEEGTDRERCTDP